MIQSFRSGYLPHSGPKVDLTQHLATPLKDSVNYYAKVIDWGMLGNDDWGCCTCASDGHIAIQQAKYGLGQDLALTTADVLRVYSAISGFDPGKGAPGSNPTDNGATIQAALEYLRKHPLGGFMIAAYGHVDPKAHDQVKHAIEEFGALSVGFNLPASVMSQNGEWTVVPGSPIDGGHCVMIAGYDAQWVYGVSWGQVVRISWEFWDTYCDEAWAIISQDWQSVSLLNLEDFGDEFAEVFGGKNPFRSYTLNTQFFDAVEEVEAEVSNSLRSLWRKLFYKGRHS